MLSPGICLPSDSTSIPIAVNPSQHTYGINTTGHLPSLSSFHWAIIRPTYHSLACLCQFHLWYHPKIGIFTYLLSSQCVTMTLRKESSTLKESLLEMIQVWTVSVWPMLSFVLTCTPHSLATTFDILPIVFFCMTENWTRMGKLRCLRSSIKGTLISHKNESIWISTIPFHFIHLILKQSIKI